jgi:hypothetical protein
MQKNVTNKQKNKLFNDGTSIQLYLIVYKVDKIDNFIKLILEKRMV